MFAQVPPDLHSLRSFQQTQERKGNVTERGRDAGSHDEQRPTRTCQLCHAKIVYVREEQRSASGSNQLLRLNPAHAQFLRPELLTIVEGLFCYFV